MMERTVEGCLNYYDNHRSLGTATEKGLAARMGGHSYNIVNGQDKHEIYFRNLRHDEHFLDKKGRATHHFMGARKRRFERDERGMMEGCFRSPGDHPRVEALGQMRQDVQLAQMENSTSWRGFQDRYRSGLIHCPKEKRYSIQNRAYSNEQEKLRPRLTSKEEWRTRRGDQMVHSVSCPSLQLSDPNASLDRAMQMDTRKETSQRQTESAHFAPWMSANTYATSMDATDHGKRMNASHQHCSVNRLENHDFGVTRKNNHYSSADKLTRSDAMYMRPRLATTNSSVKYDIVSNERKWFKYSR